MTLPLLVGQWGPFWGHIVVRILNYIIFTILNPCHENIQNSRHLNQRKHGKIICTWCNVCCWNNEWREGNKCIARLLGIWHSLTEHVTLKLKIVNIENPSNWLSTTLKKCFNDTDWILTTKVEKLKQMKVDKNQRPELRLCF